MVAYFALLSFVPLVFLALSLFGLAHRAEASDFFVRELKHAFPGTSLGSIIELVRRVQDNAAALGIIGGVGLVWSSLSFFSALESAFNIVYGLPNRRFLHGKGIAAALMATVLTTLFVSLVVGAFGGSVLKHHLRFAESSAVADIVSFGASLAGVFIFLLVIYRWLAILLLWMYVMANVIVFGAEINWWWRERKRETASAPLTGREEAPPV